MKIEITNSEVTQDEISRLRDEDGSYALLVLFSERNTCLKYIGWCFADGRFEDAMMWSGRVTDIEKAIYKIYGEEYKPPSERLNREQNLDECDATEAK